MLMSGCMCRDAEMQRCIGGTEVQRGAEEVVQSRSRAGAEVQVKVQGAEVPHS